MVSWEGYGVEDSNKIVIFGNSNFAKLVHYYFTQDSHYEVVAFAVDTDYIIDNEFSGLPIVSFEEVESLYPPEYYGMFIAIGYTSLNKLRAKKYYEAKKKGFELVSYISSSVTRWENLIIGDNCLIFENQTLQPYVTVGSNTIIWGGGMISHDSIIGDHCFIASNVTVLGNVTIEPYCFLGANATVRDGVTIARECVVGMGASVIKNTEAGGVYFGVPARLHAKRS
jgi:sugar O-acyltransferase (sialic acid O-acetyltransferase NeuD family)